MAYQIPQDVRGIIPSLAEAIFPVQAWMKQKTPPRYDQFIPAIPSVSWRPVAADPVLSTANFEIIGFLELLVDTDNESAALASRWNDIKAAPTKYFQNRLGQTPSEWRKGRAGLKADDARFGAFDPDSNNFAFVGQGTGGVGKAMSRMEFYDACWKPLAAAYTFKKPTDPAAWVAFRDNLRTDQFIEPWPTSLVVKSSSFIRQFTLDLLRACLGQRNGAITSKDPLLPRAVLIELGENRQIDHRFKVQEAGRAVATFTNTI